MDFGLARAALDPDRQESGKWPPRGAGCAARRSAGGRRRSGFDARDGRLVAAGGRRQRRGRLRLCASSSPRAGRGAGNAGIYVAGAVSGPRRRRALGSVQLLRGALRGALRRASVHRNDAPRSHGRRARRDGAPGARGQQGAVVGAQDRSARPARRSARSLAVDDGAARRAGEEPPGGAPAPVRLGRGDEAGRDLEALRAPAHERDTGESRDQARPSWPRARPMRPPPSTRCARSSTATHKRGPRCTSTPAKRPTFAASSRPTCSICAWPPSTSVSTGCAPLSQAFCHANAERDRERGDGGARAQTDRSLRRHRSPARGSAAARGSGRARRRRSLAHAARRSARAPPRRPPEGRPRGDRPARRRGAPHRVRSAARGDAVRARQPAHRAAFVGAGQPGARGSAVDRRAVPARRSRRHGRRAAGVRRRGSAASLRCRGDLGAHRRDAPAPNGRPRGPLGMALQQPRRDAPTRRAPSGSGRRRTPRGGGQGEIPRPRQRRGRLVAEQHRAAHGDDRRPPRTR